MYVLNEVCKPVKCNLDKHVLNCCQKLNELIVNYNKSIKKIIKFLIFF